MATRGICGEFAAGTACAATAATISLACRANAARSAERPSGRSPPQGRRLARNGRAAMIDRHPGRGAAWLARLTGGQEVGGSNPLAPIS